MILKNNINSLWGSIIIEELCRNGNTQFYISPGSRSTPLTFAVSKNSKANYKIIYDERSAAFHALAFAKASGKAAVLICTSGSAMSNYFPALVEAKQGNHPMIVLSADRPSELQNTGANQTMDQVDFYGKHVKKSLNFEAPSDNEDLTQLLSNIDDLIYLSHSGMMGPVHINIRFREPLAPQNQKFNNSSLKNIENWIKGTDLYKNHDQSDFEFDNIESLIEEITTMKSIVFFADTRKENLEINNSNQIVFNDVQSNIQWDESSSVINYFDQILLTEDSFNNKAELVVIVGRNTVSKRFLKYISSPKTKIYTLNEDDYKFDPEILVSNRIKTDLEKFVVSLNKIENKNQDWLNHWIGKNSELSFYLSTLETELSELKLATEFDEYFQNENVYISSSMPIRFMDMYNSKSENKFYSNRSLSGIDGVVSSAIGFAEGKKKNIYLIIGDLALIHDLNALSTLRNSPINLKIILVNNKGGGIFNFLPIADYEGFTEFFETPHEFNFKEISKQFMDRYFYLNNTKKFQNVLANFKEFEGNALLEIEVDIKENFNIYKEIQEEIIDNDQSVI